MKEYKPNTAAWGEKKHIMSKVAIYRGTAAHTAERFWKLGFECERDCTLLLKETENMQAATQPRMNGPALNPFDTKPLMELEVNNRLGTFCLKNTRRRARKENGSSEVYPKPDWTSQMAALKHVLTMRREQVCLIPVLLPYRLILQTIT